MFLWAGIAGAAAMVAFLAGQHPFALAASPIHQSQQNQSVQVYGNSLNPEIPALTQTPFLDDPKDQESTVSNLPVTEQDILQQVLRYKEQAARYAMQPGWTLVKFDQSDLIPTNSPKPLPSRYQKVFWSHFNQDKKVYEQVDYVISPETGKTPLGVFKNNEMVSLWNNNERVQKEAYTPSYDLYLASSIQAVMESNISHQLSFRQDVLSGKTISVIELRVQYTDEDKKWLNVKLEKPVWGQDENFYFDPQTGMLLKYEHFYVLEDLSLVPSAITDHFEYIPNAEPPSDMLDLLAKGGN
jgi:hypothetical protein